MQSKSLLIAIAAFAVTTTGAQAFMGTDYLNRAGLSSSQVRAFEQAHDLKRKGELSKARDVLVNAGLTEESIESLRAAAQASRKAIHEAVTKGDFAAFREAARETPLYDIVVTEADFELFKQAHNLRSEGKFVEARLIFDDLGLPQIGMKKHQAQAGIHLGLQDLTDEQKEALIVARQANDYKTAR